MIASKDEDDDGSRSIASLGGEARAAKLTSEEKSAIAKKGALVRWAKQQGLPKESHDGLLWAGTAMELPCANLDNGLRVLSATGISRAFGSGKKSPKQAAEDGAPHPPAFLAAKNLQPFISDDLREKFRAPPRYVTKRGARIAYSYEATILPAICRSLLRADRAGKLQESQRKFADAAEVFLGLLADIGIETLVDRATGYEAESAREEVERALAEAYVVPAMRPWVRMFPDAFFMHVYRLHGWKYVPGVTRGPRYVGKFINKYVYEYLPPSALERLQKLNPVIGKRRRHKHTQFLSPHIGEPAVDRHVASVTTLLSVASTKGHFDDLVHLAFPKSGDQLLIAQAVQSSALQARAEDED